MDETTSQTTDAFPMGEDEEMHAAFDMPPAKRFLTPADIRKKNDLVTEDVYVSEWEGWVKVKALTAKERDDFEASFVKKRNGKRDYDPSNMRALLVVRTAVNEDYTQMFGSEAAAWLGQKNASAVNKIYNVASRLCGISEGDEDELSGNSKRTNGSNSGTQSH
jgi:hypothetical protein